MRKRPLTTQAPGRHLQAVSVLLLLVMISLPASGAASHYCFDGLEPPVSVHFDNLNGHVDHAEEAAHSDVEKRIFDDNLVGKLSAQDVALPGHGFWAALQPTKARFHYSTDSSDTLFASLWRNTPPLRAPPA